MAAISPATPRSRWIAPVLLLLGSVFFVLIWILLSLYTGKTSSWMAVLGAVDAALILRFSGMQPGVARAIWAVMATLGMIALANWGIAAVQMGISMGMNPWESAQKLGLEHAWTLAGVANQTVDLVWMGVALVVAAIAAR